MVRDSQVRLLRKKMADGLRQEAAAAAAGMSVRSARMWQDGPLPSETKEERAWRTRPDPFEAVWDKEVMPLLVADKHGVLEATTVARRVAPTTRRRIRPFAPLLVEDPKRDTAERYAISVDDLDAACPHHRRTKTKALVVGAIREREASPIDDDVDDRLPVTPSHRRLDGHTDQGADRDTRIRRRVLGTLALGAGRYDFTDFAAWMFGEGGCQSNDSRRPSLVAKFCVPKLLVGPLSRCCRCSSHARQNRS
jgi:hypothetical protein